MLKILLGKNEKLLPHTWREITIRQYQELTTLNYEDKNIDIDIVSLFTGLSEEVLMNMAYDEMLKLYTICSKSLVDIDRDAKVKYITYNKKKYKMPTHLYKMKTKEVLSVEHLREDIIQNIHKIIPIIFRLDIDSELVLDMSCEIAISTINFILAHVQK